MENKNRLVVADLGWAETIPDWLKKEVETERLIEGFKNACSLTERNGGSPRVGLAETCVYLYTASLKYPLGYHLTRIYQWVLGKVARKSLNRTSSKGQKLPDFVEQILKEGLDPEEERELNDLRETLYRKRGGEIRSPLFDALKALKKKALKKEIFKNAPKTASL